MTDTSTSPVVIRAIEYANYAMPCHFAGQYLAWYEPNGSAGSPLAGFTDDITHAKVFPDAGAAIAEWNRVRTVDPVRPDGRPNKPLTAITITIEPKEMPRE